VESNEEQTVGQKVEMALKAAGAFARNPKALVALMRYQLSARRQAKQQKES
jgi:hypothetical protein